MFSPSRSETSSFDKSSELHKRQEVENLRSELKDLQMKMSRVHIEDIEYESTLARTQEISELLRVRKQEVTDYRQQEREAKERFDQLSKDKTATGEQREQAWQAWEEARDAAEASGEVSESAKLSTKARLNETEEAEQLNQELSSDPSMLGWTSFMDRDKTDQRWINLKSKIVIGMDDMYKVNKRAGPMQNVLPHGTKLPVLFKSLVQAPVPFSESQIQTPMPGPPSDKQDNRGRNITSTNRDARGYDNFCPKHFMQTFISVLGLNNIRYQAGVTMLLAPDRMDSEVKETIRESKDSSVLKHVLQPL